MKKVLLVLMVVALTLAVVAIALGQPVNNVKNTKHNLSTSQTGTYRSTNEDQICVFCHTPHQSTGINTDPLWNHTLSSVLTYGVYSSITLNATPAEIGSGTSASNLCMSCHDGTVAVNSLYNPSNDLLGAQPTMAAGNFITGNANLGNDLSNDHPVNFTYDTALATADGGLHNPATTVVPGYGVRTIAQVLTPGNQLQCSSCHGAHIDYSGAQAGYSPFLKVDNTGSALCLTCHSK